MRSYADSVVLQLILYWPSVVRLLTDQPDYNKQWDELHDNA